MMHRPLPSRQWNSAFTLSSRRISLRRLLALLVPLLQSRPVQGQFQQDFVCTIKPRPVLVGLGSTPEDNWFGHRISISQNGTITAIGTPYYNNDGYIQVFRFKNNAWTQLGRTIFGGNSTFTYSNALSDDGSVLAVGGWLTSSVRVFRLVDNDWEPLGNNITNEGREDIGDALAISGDGTILAASSPYATSNVGEVQVFELVGGTWSQKGRTIKGQGKEHDFGDSLSLSRGGSRLAVGIPDIYYGEMNGYVRVFEFVDNDWVQIGQTLQGTNIGDEFGKDVSLSSDGRTLAVGAPQYDGNSENLGSVHVYRLGSDGLWFEPGSMLIGKSEDKFFGESVALSGDASILVASRVGLLRFFVADGNEWIEVGEEATNSSDHNNAAIARDGSAVMGGASAFDFSCPPGTTPDTATASPVLSPLSQMPVPVPLSMSAPVEAPVETSIPAPLLSSSPTESTEPQVKQPTASTETLPTSAPRTNSTAGTPVQETFSDITLSFSGARLMSGPESETYERLTKGWFEAFFIERSGRELQTMIAVTKQKFMTSEDESAPVNKITYKQTIIYTKESNNVDAKSYITLPFKDFSAITEYGETLKSHIDAFQRLQSPIPVPQFETGGDNNDGEGNIIVGATIGGALFLAIVVFVGIRVNKRKDDAWEGRGPPSAAGVIVYDGQGEALASRTVPAQAVLLASDNATILQKDSTKVQSPSAGLLEASPPQQEIDTLVPEPMAVSTPSNGYVVQFKDQARSAAPDRLAQRDP